MQVQRVQNNKYNTQFGAKARRVDFSLPILWLTKVNPTYECNFVQKCARIVQKMSKKVQEKSLLE